MFDYGMNSYINNEDKWWGPDPFNNKYGFIYQIDRISEPSRTVLLGDNGGLKVDNSCLIPWVPSWAQICPRHNQEGANLLFLDAHATLYYHYPITAGVPWEQSSILDGTIWKLWQIP